jgi:predicted heme/steroid binding protein
MENNFKEPQRKIFTNENIEQIIITSDDIIPENNSFGNLLQKEIIKENSQTKGKSIFIKYILIVFASNNRLYTKKEEIEYGKKSHLEYIKIMNQNKDPLNVQAKGGLRPITMSEIKKHNTEGNMWTILNGKVYDLTMYIDYHPGGIKKIMMGAGKDCTSLYSIKIF